MPMSDSHTHVKKLGRVLMFLLGAGMLVGAFAILGRFPVVQTERTYYELNALMREIYDARVWAGLHWRHAMMDGAQIGRKVGKYVWDNFFRPTP
jgi:hypothetical protein